MICMFGLYKLTQQRGKRVLNSNMNERERFFFDSIGDETYLDLIREKIEYLIDEGYKYSEQLDMINKGSGRNIPYRVYVDFVKREVLQDPSLLFQPRSNQYQQFPPYGYFPQYPQQQSEESRGDSSLNVKTESSDNREESVQKEEVQQSDEVEEPVVDFRMNLKRNNSSKSNKEELEASDKKDVGGSKIKPKKSREEIEAEEKNKILFQHEAMPDVDQLY